MSFMCYDCLTFTASMFRRTSLFSPLMFS